MNFNKVCNKNDVQNIKMLNKIKMNVKEIEFQNSAIVMIVHNDKNDKISGMLHNYDFNICENLIVYK